MGEVTASAIAAWWGYARGNQAVVTLVTLLVVIAAIGYLTRRWWQR
jgi:hypothetical protein